MATSNEVFARSFMEVSSSFYQAPWHLAGASHHWTISHSGIGEAAGIDPRRASASAMRYRQVSRSRPPSAAVYATSSVSLASPSLRRIARAAPTSQNRTVPVPIQPALAPDWLARFNWLAFDGTDFFARYGIAVDANAGGAGMLFAMRRYLPPMDATDSLPLAIAHLYQPRLEQFVAAVMATISPVEQMQKIPESSAPAFLENIYKTWFLQYASPPSGDGNGGPHRAPFHDSLLRLIHPASPQRDVCGDGRALPLSRSLPRSLPRIGRLKHELRAAYLQSYARLDAVLPHHARLEREWTFNGLCEIFEPTLLRKDLPESFRYGSLAWALLAAGIALAGKDAEDIPMHALMSLGLEGTNKLLSDHPKDTNLQEIRHKVLDIILRMAHAHGKIDLLDKSALTGDGAERAMRSNVRIAIRFFETQLLDEKKKLPPLETLIANVPTREESTVALLRQKGLNNRRILIMPPMAPGQGRMLPNAQPEKPCMPQPRAYPLSEILRTGCLPQLLQSKSSSRHERAILQDEAFSDASLTERFETAYDTHAKPLAHAAVLPRLEEMIAGMDAAEQAFWDCAADWEVRLVSAWLATRRRGPGVRGPSGIAGDFDPVILTKAQDSVLIRLTLPAAASASASGGKPQVRKYLLELQPFRLTAYTAADEDFLAANMLRVFKPLKAGDKLLGLNRQRALVYDDASPRNAAGGFLETIAERLMRHQLAVQREIARQTTQPELQRARLKEMWLEMFIPFLACAEAIKNDQLEQAKLACVLDAAGAAGMLRPVAASVRLGKAMFAVGRLSTRQIAALTRAYVTGNIRRGGASLSVATTLRLGKPALRAGREMAYWFDPGVSAVWHAGNVGAHVGARLANYLMKKFRGYKQLRPLISRLRKTRDLMRKFDRVGGYWHARKNAVSLAGNRPHVAFRGRQYELATIGGIANIPVKFDAATHQVRLLDPDSGLPYGPIMRSGGNAAALPEDTPASVICRTKRGGDGALDACLLASDARFGPAGYAQKNQPFINYQMPLTEAVEGAEPLRPVNLLDVGYATSEESASGWRDIAPGLPLAPVYTAEAMHGVGYSLVLPPQINARVVRLPQAVGGSVDYIAFTLNHFDIDSTAIVYNTRYVPIASYEELDAVVGIAYCDPRMPYRFSVKRHRLPLSSEDLAVTLTRATPREMEKFNKFQMLLGIDQRIANPLVADAVRLRDETIEVREKFEEVFKCSEDVLDQAIEAAHLFPDVVQRILGKIVGLPPGDPKLGVILTKLRHRAEQIQDAMPYLKSQSPDVIGFFEGEQGGDMLILANTLGDSMRLTIGFAKMNKALITFLRSHFMSRFELTVRHAMTLLHEFDHALHDSSDAMRVGGAPVYPLVEHETVDLSMLTAQARLEGSDPGNHAPTFEVFTELCSYLMRADQRDIALQYLESAGNSYTRIMTLRDLGMLLTLRDDIGK